MVWLRDRWGTSAGEDARTTAGLETGATFHETGETVLNTGIDTGIRGSAAGNFYFNSRTQIFL